MRFKLYTDQAGSPHELAGRDLATVVSDFEYVTGSTVGAASVWCESPEHVHGPAGGQWESADQLLQAVRHDEAEEKRRAMVQSGQPARDLDHAEALGQETWTTEQMQRDFQVEGFVAPFVVVRRKSDGKRGTLEFTHSPRVYFGWKEHQE